MNKINIKTYLPHIVAVTVFLILTLIYLSPAAFEGKKLIQEDGISGVATGVDLKEYHKETGDYAHWSNTMFSGMPANQTYHPNTFNIFEEIGRFFRLRMSVSDLGAVFFYMVGFYIFLVSLGCKSWLSAVGAIAYAFGSYNLIIIGAGHANKALVMATMAPIIGGVILCYKKKYLIGALVTLVFTGLNIVWMHQQISYYLLIILLILAIVYFIYAIRDKQLKEFFKSSTILLLVAALSGMPAIVRLWGTADYAKSTMRGGAVLENSDKEQKGNTSKTGLDIDYAFAWSYGRAETMTLLIPNFYGANSHYDIGEDSECYNVLRNTGQAAQFCKYAPTYWGVQPFTSGPTYFGAIVCFLFVLGLFLVKGPEKWWLLAATIVSIMLSWGKNLEWFNVFLFDNLPLYNKFRVPAMALVMANVTVVTLAILALKEFFAVKKNKETLRKPLLISAGITAGVCLFFALFGGSLFNFSAAADANYPEYLQDALLKDRAQMLKSDAWRSFIFIALAFSVLWFAIKKQMKEFYIVLGLGFLILIDLWTVDKRFLNDTKFREKKEVNTFIPTQADRQILQDTDPNYRVLNLALNTFNDATTSYFHKSVGGYSAAKMQRYQDIIDYHFARGLNMDVLNMLNTKYFIVANKQQGGQPMAQLNREALGNAWFVDSIKWVNNPNEEIEALYDFDPLKIAFIDTVWKSKLDNLSALQGVGDGLIKFIKFENPGYLIYESNNDKAQLAVFSEVFYKTWKAYIDGEEVPVVRVNYILRGLAIPEGKHTIEFKCIDEIYEKGGIVSVISTILIISTILLLLFGLYWQDRKKCTLIKKGE